MLHNLVKAKEGFYHVEKTLVTGEDIVEMAKSYLATKLRTGSGFTNPTMVKDYLIAHYSQEEREIFGILILDTQHRVIAVENLFYGTISSAAVYPREIVKSVLENNGASVCLFHNHPSGETKPSEADKRVTKVIIEALKVIEVDVIDHLIVGGNRAASFAELGLI